MVLKAMSGFNLRNSMHFRVSRVNVFCRLRGVVEIWIGKDFSIIHSSNLIKLKERKKSIFKVHGSENSLWNRLLFHLAFVLGPFVLGHFPVKFYNNYFQLLNKLFVE